MSFQGRYEVQHHNSILAAAVTFCLGLAAFRAVLGFVLGHAIQAPAFQADALNHLQLLAAAATVLYLILRRAEGDFRALLLVSLMLFAACEGLAALARSFGVLTLEGLAALFNLALFLYSSLAVTASLADGPKRDNYQRALTVAAMGFMLVAALRAFFDMSKPPVPEFRRNAAVAGLFAVMICAVVALVLAQEYRLRRTQAASEPPLPGPVPLPLDKPAGEP